MWYVVIISILFFIFSIVMVTSITSFFYIRKNILLKKSTKKTISMFEFDLKNKYIKITRYYNFDLEKGNNSFEPYYLTFEEFKNEYEFDSYSKNFLNILFKKINNKNDHGLLEEISRTRLNIYYKNDNNFQKEVETNSFEYNRFTILKINSFDLKEKKIIAYANEYHSNLDMSWALENKHLSFKDFNLFSEKILEKKSKKSLLYLFEFERDFLPSRVDFLLFDAFFNVFKNYLINKKNCFVLNVSKHQFYIYVPVYDETINEKKLIDSNLKEIIELFKTQYSLYFSHPIKNIFKNYSTVKKINSISDLHYMFIELIVKRTIDNSNLEDAYPNQNSIKEKTNEVFLRIEKIISDLKSKKISIDKQSIILNNSFKYVEFFLSYEQDPYLSISKFSLFFDESLIDKYISKVNRNISRNQTSFINIQKNFINHVFKNFEKLNKNLMISISFAKNEISNFLVEEIDLRLINLISPKLLVYVSSLDLNFIKIVNTFKPKYIILEKQFLLSENSQEKEIFISTLKNNMKMYNGKVFEAKN